MEWRTDSMHGQQTVEGGMEVANEEVPRDKSDFVIRMERIQDWEL